MMSSTVSPATHDTGLPPAEEKNEPCAANASAIARVVITAPSGCPFPIAFAIVMTSGTTPCISKAHQWWPSRP